MEDRLNSSSRPSNLSSSSDFRSVFTEEVLPPLYLALCIVGLLLNAVASFVFCRVPSDAALVVYLKNMLLADLLMLIYFPFKLLAQLGVGGWRLHVIMCRFVAVLFYFSMYTGIMFMGLISLERYTKIVRNSQPTVFGRVSVVHFLQSPGSAFTVAVGTWGLMLLSTLPNVLLTSRDANETNARRCMDLKTELGVRWHKASSIFSVGVFWLTLVVMVTCYTSIGVHVYRSCRRVRSNSSVCRKSRRSILSLLLVFALCFVPYHLCRIPYTLSQMPWSGFSQHSRFVLFQVKEATLMLASVNVCLDPLVYFLMCRSFRHTLLQSLRRRAKPAGEARSMGTSTAVVLFNVSPQSS
ncbi:P2Y purinoceptor 14-like [Boleophthalmus pectinirostris]|uniref:P2Y purinoceptor 14-like n=1 Tax=Boleophthalmus pectinirostris TaxID=150288 RepID=UPI0024315C36|nr:P2Y purinoceptor 14-like [Boleophthalmus pectinirostris]XP_055022600.1 P2Y purinoceptor 14-like [Boleophthalmus pectinirostris]